MPTELRDIWLWGTGDEHITFTWRAGKASQKYGGTFDGIIPELLEKYRTSQSPMQIRQLEKYMSVIRCPDCDGQRLNPQARAVTIATRQREVRRPAGADAARSLRAGRSPTRPSSSASSSSTATQQLIAAEVLKEIRGRLGFLKNVGLDYLTLDRTAPTLSGGESQRIRLAGQIGCGLVGVLYILDEPSIGLHPRDNDRLLATLAELRDLGNTVVVVEHDEDTMRAADHIIDFGPGPGVRGGEVVATGDGGRDRQAKRAASPGRFSSGKRKIEVPAKRRIAERGCEDARTSMISIHRTSILVPRSASSAPGTTISRTSTSKFRSGAFVCVTGVSGSGKSSLVNDILAEALLTRSDGRQGPARRARPHRGRRPARQADRHRPIADRPHAALESRHVHQAVRRHPQPLHAAARVEAPRLQAGPVQLQRAGRPLRSVRGQRLEPARNGFPGRRVGHVPGLRAATASIARRCR